MCEAEFQEVDYVEPTHTQGLHGGVHNASCLSQWFCVFCEGFPSDTRTYMHTSFSIDHTFSKKCVKTAAAALCCVSTRRDVAKNTRWFSVGLHLLYVVTHSLAFHITFGYRAAAAPEQNTIPPQLKVLTRPSLHTYWEWLCACLCVHVCWQTGYKSVSVLLAIWI